MDQWPEVSLDLSNPFWAMRDDQKAEFLERVAQKADRCGDPTAALTARMWSDKLLEKHQLPPLGREPREELKGDLASKRLYEAARWAQSPEVYLYVSGRVLYNVCLGLHTKLNLERADGRGGIER